LADEIHTIVCHGTVTDSEKSSTSTNEELAVGDFGMSPAVANISSKVLGSEAVGFLEVIDVEASHFIQTFNDLEVRLRLVGLELYVGTFNSEGRARK